MAISQPTYPTTTSALVSHVGAYADAQDAGKVDKSTLTAKGDLYVASASGVITRIPAGTDGQVLTAASGQATGLQWTPAGGLTVQNEGSALTQRATLDFVGADVNVTDDAPNARTIVTVSSSGGSGPQTIVTLPGPTTPDASSLAAVGAIVGAPTLGSTHTSFGGEFVLPAGGRVEFPGVALTTAFTVEAWVKRSRSGLAETIVSRYDWSSQGSSLFVLYFGGSGDDRLWFGVQNATPTLVQTQVGPAITDTNWHHVVGVFTGTQIFAAIDGVAGSPASIATLNTPSSTMPFIIGDDQSHVTQLVGSVDEVRISNVARYTTAGFTPPAAPFTSDANTRLLAHLDSIGATNYEIGATDAGKLLRVTSGTPTSVTIPADPNGIAIGESVDIGQLGAGAVTVAPSVGMTMWSDAAQSGSRLLHGQGVIATVMKTAANEYVLAGSLT